MSQSVADPVSKFTFFGMGGGEGADHGHRTVYLIVSLFGLFFRNIRLGSQGDLNKTVSSTQCSGSEVD